MSKLHRQMEIDMHLGNYAERTRKVYLDAIAGNLQLTAQN